MVKSIQEEYYGTLQTSFFDHTLLAGVLGGYDFTNGSSDFVVRLLYFPGDNFFYEVSYQQVNDGSRQAKRFGDTRGTQRDMQDQVIFNIRYEF